MFDLLDGWIIKILHFCSLVLNLLGLIHFRGGLLNLICLFTVIYSSVFDLFDIWIIRIYMILYWLFLCLIYLMVRSLETYPFAQWFLLFYDWFVLWVKSKKHIYFHHQFLLFCIWFFDGIIIRNWYIPRLGFNLQCLMYYMVRSL